MHDAGRALLAGQVGGRRTDIEVRLVLFLRDARDRLSRLIAGGIEGFVSASTAPAAYLFIHGLHKFKKLRHEDDFSFSAGGGDDAPNTGAQFNELITEGSGGMPPFGDSISAEEKDNVIAYLKTL